MVESNFTYSNQRSLWPVYLVISLCINALIIASVNSATFQTALPDTPVLRVNLMALAAPAPLPTPEKPVAEAAPPVIEKPVVTAPEATKKMAMTQPKPIPPKKLLNTPREKKTQDVTQKKNVKQHVASVPSQNRGKDKSTVVVHEANYRRQTPPVYPHRALELGQQGVVTLHAEILPDGYPRALKVAKSSGHRLLDMAAIAAVKKWEFEPRTRNGSATTSWVRVPVRFIIQ